MNPGLLTSSLSVLSPSPSASLCHRYTNDYFFYVFAIKTTKRVKLLLIDCFIFKTQSFHPRGSGDKMVGPLHVLELVVVERGHHKLTRQFWCGTFLNKIWKAKHHFSLHSAPTPFIFYPQVMCRILLPIFISELWSVPHHSPPTLVTSKGDS